MHQFLLVGLQAYFAARANDEDLNDVIGTAMLSVTVGYVALVVVVVVAMFVRPLAVGALDNRYVSRVFRRLGIWRPRNAPLYISPLDGHIASWFDEAHGDTSADGVDDDDDADDEEDVVAALAEWRRALKQKDDAAEEEAARQRTDARRNAAPSRATDAAAAGLLRHKQHTAVDVAPNARGAAWASRDDDDGAPTELDGLTKWRVLDTVPVAQQLQGSHADADVRDHNRTSINSVDVDIDRCAADSVDSRDSLGNRVGDRDADGSVDSRRSSVSTVRTDDDALEPVATIGAAQCEAAARLEAREAARHTTLIINEHSAYQRIYIEYLRLATRAETARRCATRAAAHAVAAEEK
jgi:hypothetical protein